MRRVGVVLLVALAAVSGCVTRPEVVPGNAAPITGSATGSRPATPSGSPLPPVPTDFRALTMTGSGVSVTVPVPSGWARKPGSPTTGVDRTDVDLQDPEVLLRIDLTARGPGSAQAAALRTESGTQLTSYRRLGITAVPGVGDDAVDWTFTFERDGTRRAVDRQILSGTATVAVYFSAPRDLYARYLPVWQRAVREVEIRTS